MSLLTRLAKRYDAVMNVKDANLLFMPIGHGTTLSGKKLESIELTRADADSHRYHVSERENHAGVRAHYHATGRAKRKSVVVGGENNQNIKVLPKTYANEADARTAETPSFAEAGWLLGVSSSAVGKSIARTEDRLGVRLFHRSTRSMTLTAEGSLFLERCRRILGEVEAAEAELSDAAGSPRGRLRISTPQLSELIMPALDGFMAQYPDIELDADLSDRMVDIIEEGFDAVIRTGEQHDSRLVSRRLGSCGQVLVASPGYLKRQGEPRHPSELVRHACLLHKFPATGKLERWPFKLAASEADPELPQTFVSNTIEVLGFLALQDKGLAFLPTFLVRDALASGALQIVLDDFIDQTVTFAIAPGPVETAMLDRVTGSADRKAAFLTNVPLKRAAPPEEIADAIVFVASDKASFITGEIIRINGGKTAA
jgi:DNA-binding transcriptional LysR family regulator